MVTLRISQMWTNFQKILKISKYKMKQSLKEETNIMKQDSVLKI